MPGRFFLTLVFLGNTLAFAQVVPKVDTPPPPRYGVQANLEFLPQYKPKETLTTLAKVLERKKYDYLVARLLDPAFVEARVADRAKLLEGEVDKEFRTKRDEQKRNPAKYEAAERLSDDPPTFAKAVKEEASLRAFRLIAREVRRHLDDNPDYLRELELLQREGTITESGETATAEHKDVKGKKLYLRRVDGLWYLEDRTTEKKK